MIAAGLGITGLVLLLGRLVTGELALNSAEAVRPGADQVSFYVFQFVLIEFQLRLGQVNLLLQAVCATLILGAGELLLQLVDPLLIRFDGRCRPDWPGRTVSCSRASAERDARWPGASRS